MVEPIRTDDSLELWHRRLCPVTDWLVLSGDLHHQPLLAEAQIAQWCATGITAVIDTRAEWTDADFVAEVLGGHLKSGHTPTSENRP